jgi:hypothetical protein
VSSSGIHQFDRTVHQILVYRAGLKPCSFFILFLHFHFHQKENRLIPNLNSPGLGFGNKAAFKFSLRLLTDSSPLHCTVELVAITFQHIFAVFTLQQFFGTCLIPRNLTMKPKCFVFIALVLFFANATQAQITNEFKTVLVTNWVKSGPFLRVVDGVTYNAAYSINWGTFSHWESLGLSIPDPESGGSSHLVGSVGRIFGTTVFISVDREHWSQESYTGTPYKTHTEPDHVIVVFNCEHPDKMDFYCMKTTNYIDHSGVPYKAYDCGIQATNPVEVIKKIRVKN